MQGKPGTQKQLIQELTARRRQVAKLQELAASHERTEAMLEREGQHYRALLENLFDLVCEIDSEGHMLYISPNHAEIIGFDPGERLGHSIFENVHPDDLPLILREFKLGMERAFGHVIYRHKNKNGEWRWLETRGRLYEGEDGKQRGVLVTRDITEQKRGEEALRWAHEGLEKRVRVRTAELQQANEILRTEVTQRRRAEEALQESEARYRSLFERNPDAVYSFDLRGNFLEVNSACSRITGYLPEEFLKTSFASLMVPEDLPKTMNYFRKAAEGEPQNYEVAILRKDGSRVELNVTNVPIVVNDRIVGVYGVAKDITERKRVEVALKRSEESAKKLADENAAIAQIGRIISSSMNIEEVYEEFKKEVGRLISFERIAINMVDAEDGNLDSPYVAGSGVPGRKEAEVISLAGEGAEWVLQNRLSLLLGKENWREIAGLFPGLRPIFRAGFKTCMIVALISGGRVIGILSFLSIRPDAYCEDDLKLAERIGSQISRAIDNAQLFLGSMRAEEELKKSRDQLRALAEHLQSVREEDRTRIARWIHDEVGQALTRIGVDLWGLAADSPKEKQSLKGKIESISEFVGATMELVRRMSTELRPSVLDLGLVAALEWQAQEFQNRTGIQCECQVSSDEVNLPGDHSTAVFRIFQEILTNVVRHAKASRVAVALKRPADSVVLEVKDNGRGISQSEISDPKALGLLGMRERAILFGGEVNFISVPGRGTTVVVRIPLKSER